MVYLELELDWLVCRHRGSDGHKVDEVPIADETMSVRIGLHRDRKTKTDRIDTRRSGAYPYASSAASVGASRGCL